MSNQYHITIQAIVSCDDENDWVPLDNLDLSNLCSSLISKDPHTGINLCHSNISLLTVHIKKSMANCYYHALSSEMGRSSRGLPSYS